jgi:uncharacterized damage-inducible protein DinB
VKLASLIVEELDREAELTRRALEQVPPNKGAWKPHEKSMPLGQLAQMIATMPSWISMIVEQDELDIKPAASSYNGAARILNSSEELIEAHDKAVAAARKAVSKKTDKYLQTPWKLLEGGRVAQENPRYQFILDNFTHLAHHRGPLTVYLRMNGEKVPAIYGPSADDHRF